ncbi:MAG: hypothetical protein V1885_02570 [Candidatus Brennerbacteria bacterium]
MKTTISVDQRFGSLATLGGNTAWDDLTVDEVQLIHREPGVAKRAGADYTRFVKNGYCVQIQVVDVFRDTGELSIPIPALARPTLAELRAKFPGIRAEGGIERDDSLVEARTLNLGTVLLPDEVEENKSISGRAFESRLLPKRDVLYGYQHGAWIVEHQDEFPALKPLLGKVYILLPGLVVVHVGGGRRAFSLGSDGERWSLHWDYLAYAVLSGVRVAFSGQLRRSDSEVSK